MMTTGEEAALLCARVFPRMYRDSVALMSLAASLGKLDGVLRAGVVMATPANLGVLDRSGLRAADLTVSPDDLVVSVLVTGESAAEKAFAEAERGLAGSGSVGTGEAAAARRPTTLDEGLAELPDATMAAVSTPGEFAAVEIRRALRRGLHVFCFSDNVPLADEVALKREAAERGLLLMGPDCGTALIDGVPLGFTNVLRGGPAGLISASGTGAQEVSCQLDRLGVGVSQIVGVGGRDLSADVGGMMMNHALDLLAGDDQTQVVVLISKPPDPEVSARLTARLRDYPKPVVVCFFGQQTDGITTAATLEEAAILAAARLGVTGAEPAPPIVPVAGAAASGGTAGGPGRASGGSVLGLYTGGTLASEARLLLARAGVPATVLDLGDDEYTVGRPHPMIDPRLRAERVAAAGEDPDVGVLLVDLVLGWGSSPDPAGPLAEAVTEATARAAAAGRRLLTIGSVCGTPADPQDAGQQRQALTDVGVIVTHSNAAAARLAARWIKEGL